MSQKLTNTERSCITNSRLSLAEFIVKELDTAYGGVNHWSEADAFEDIYEVCYQIIEEDKKQIRVKDLPSVKEK